MSGRRSRTVSPRALARELKRQRRAGELEPLEGLEVRPQLRSQCRGAERPCPFVSCRFNLFLDVDPRRGSIQFNFPGKELEELEHTCALDIAEEGGATLEAVGKLLNVTRERVRQIEAEALEHLQATPELAA